MKFIHYISLSLFLTVASSNVSAQLQKSDTKPANSFCTDFHLKACSFERKDINFKYNSQSRSALFRPGQSSKLVFTATKGYDYRMTFAAEESVLNGGKIHFKLIDARTKAVLFDSEESGATEFEFICDSSINIQVEITLPEGSAETKSKVVYGCVGFLLESRPSLNTGF